MPPKIKNATHNIPPSNPLQPEVRSQEANGKPRSVAITLAYDGNKKSEMEVLQNHLVSNLDCLLNAGIQPDISPGWRKKNYRVEIPQGPEKPLLTLDKTYVYYVTNTGLIKQGLSINFDGKVGSFDYSSIQSIHGTKSDITQVNFAFNPSEVTAFSKIKKTITDEKTGNQEVAQTLHEFEAFHTSAESSVTIHENHRANNIVENAFIAERTPDSVVFYKGRLENNLYSGPGTRMEHGFNREGNKRCILCEGVWVQGKLHGKAKITTEHYIKYQTYNLGKRIGLEHVVDKEGGHFLLQIIGGINYQVKIKDGEIVLVQDDGDLVLNDLVTILYQNKAFEFLDKLFELLEYGLIYDPFIQRNDWFPFYIINRTQVQLHSNKMFLTIYPDWTVENYAQLFALIVEETKEYSDLIFVKELSKINTLFKGQLAEIQPFLTKYSIPYHHGHSKIPTQQDLRQNTLNLIQSEWFCRVLETLRIIYCKREPNYNPLTTEILRQMDALQDAQLHYFTAKFREIEQQEQAMRSKLVLEDLTGQSSDYRAELDQLHRATIHLFKEFKSKCKELESTHEKAEKLAVVEKEALLTSVKHALDKQRARFQKKLWDWEHTHRTIENEAVAAMHQLLGDAELALSEQKVLLESERATRTALQTSHQFFITYFTRVDHFISSFAIKKREVETNAWEATETVKRDALEKEGFSGLLKYKSTFFKGENTNPLHAIAVDTVCSPRADISLLKPQLPKELRALLKKQSPQAEKRAYEIYHGLILRELNKAGLTLSPAEIVQFKLIGALYEQHLNGQLLERPPLPFYKLYTPAKLYVEGLMYCLHNKRLDEAEFLRQHLNHEGVIPSALEEWLEPAKLLHTLEKKYQLKPQQALKYIFLIAMNKCWALNLPMHTDIHPKDTLPIKAIEELISDSPEGEKLWDAMNLSANEYLKFVFMDKTVPKMEVMPHFNVSG